MSDYVSHSKYAEEDQGSEDGRNILPPGKELKSGLIRLNVDKDYLSRWTTREAFREFVQNWKDAILRTFGLEKQQHRFRVDIDDSGDEYLAKAYDDRNRQELLGFVSYSQRTGIVQLTNFKAQLSRRYLNMGSSTKRDNKDLAGSHGEGFKIAALLMTGNGYRVRYEANKFYWKFRYTKADQEALHCDLSRIADSVIQGAMEKHNLELAQGLKRGPTANCWEDVTVEIGMVGNVGSKVELAKFRDWLKSSLDLNPPKKPVITKFGTLILDPEYHGRVYLKGLLLGRPPETQGDAPDALPVDQARFGYNIFCGEAGRDRECLTGSTEIYHFGRIWTYAISVNPAETTKLFIDMLQEADLCADVRESKRYMTKEAAKLIWQRLRRDDRNHENFYHDSKNKERDANFIKTSLNRVPVQLPSSLWDPISEFGIIWTPQEERRRLLRSAPPATYDDTLFALNVKRALAAAFKLDERTKGLTLLVKDGEKADFDLLLDGSNVIIHKRWLDFYACHRSNPCRLSLSASTEDFKDKDYNSEVFSCDHVVIFLYGLLHSQLIPESSWGGQTVSDSFLLNKVADRLTQMPRRVEITPGPNVGEIEVSWTDADGVSLAHKLISEVRVTLHKETTCCNKRSDHLNSQEASNDKIRMSETSISTQLHDSRSECNCRNQTVLHRDLKVKFEGLDPEQEYFPMVASVGHQAFYSHPPNPVRPKQFERVSSDSHSQATLPSRKARPANGFSVNSPDDSGVDTFSVSNDTGDEMEIDSSQPRPPPQSPEKDATKVYASSDFPSSNVPRPSGQNFNQSADTSNNATEAENGPDVVQTQTENEVVPEYLDVTQEAPRASGLGQVGIEQVVGEVETMQRQLYDLRAKFQKVQQENEALREKFQPDAEEQASNSGREGTFNASHRPYQAAERQVTNSSNDQGEQPWSAGADRSRECIHEQANRELQNTIQQLQTELAALKVEMAGLRQQKGALDSIIQIASGVLHSRRPDTQGSYEAARARSAQAAGRSPSVVGFKRRSIGDGHGSSGMPMGVAKRSRQATVESDLITE